MRRVRRGLGAQPNLRIVRIASADAELRKTLIDECLAGCLIALDGARNWMGVKGQGNARRISLQCLPRGGPITGWRPIPGFRRCLPKRHHSRASSRPEYALGGDEVEIAGHRAQAASGAMVAVADRDVNRRFRGVIGTVARP